MIETIDVDGATTRSVQQGRMATIAHEAIMHALDYRARGPHLPNKPNDSSTIDETGTVDMANIMYVLEERDQIAVTEQQERQSVRDLGTTDEALRVHGIDQQGKRRGSSA